MTETFCVTRGWKSRPAKAGHQPEPSVAWSEGDLGCEAYTGGCRLRDRASKVINAEPTSLA
jgi:hypothetical protein